MDPFTSYFALPKGTLRNSTSNSAKEIVVNAVSIAEVNKRMHAIVLDGNKVTPIQAIKDIEGCGTSP